MKKYILKSGEKWIDALEAGDLVETKGSTEIDTGSRRMGTKLNRIWKIKCPSCNVPMLPVHAVEQPRIQLESCPACHGSFFDAGEFRDLCEEPFLERVKGWLAIKR